MNIYLYRGISGWWYEILDGERLVHRHSSDDAYRTESSAKRAALRKMDELEKEKK